MSCGRGENVANLLSPFPPHPSPVLGIRETHLVHCMAEVRVAMYVCMSVTVRSPDTFFMSLHATFLYAFKFIAMVCACRFVNTSGRAILAVWHMHGVVFGLGHTSKMLPEATIGCKVLLHGHRGPQALRDSSQQSCQP